MSWSLKIAFHVPAKSMGSAWMKRQVEAPESRGEKEEEESEGETKTLGNY